MHSVMRDHKTYKLSKSATHLNSLMRGLEVLEAIAQAGGMQVKEIAHQLRINLSTCYHTLNTLEEAGYLVKQRDGTYVLGSKIPYLNNLFRQSIVPQQILWEGLQRLADLSGETVYLGSERNNAIEIQWVIESPKMVRVPDIYVGCNDYPHARLLPKAIMAFWPERKLDRFYQGYDFVPFTARTPLNLEQLKIQLEETRLRGYCYDDQEMYPGVCCLAAPIFQPDGNVASAYGIAVPHDRFAASKDYLIQILLEVSREVSCRLGGDGTPARRRGRKHGCQAV
jgi:DNA-binding IclR family transcriptional regulator